MAGAAVCVLWSKKLAVDCVLAEEKRGRVWVDDKNKVLLPGMHKRGETRIFGECVKREVGRR